MDPASKTKFFKSEKDNKINNNRTKKKQLTLNLMIHT